jgi:hypothetical protein
MTGCASACASYSPVAGDSFIFRGGDTWAVATGNPWWNWTWSGSVTNCNLNAAAGAVTKSSCIYIGVNQTWFTGASWVRPVFNGGNTLSTSYHACTNDYFASNVFFIRNPYVIVDNLEWTGFCDASSSGAGAGITFLGTATMDEVTNNYFHGWTLANSSAQDQFRQISCNGTGCAAASYIRIDHNVFDGSDSSLGTTPGKATGFATGAGYEIDNNVFSHLSNIYIGGQAVRIHDNFITYIFEPSDGVTHGNIFEQQGSTTATYFYNNLSFVTNEGEGEDLYSGTSLPVDVFNNISFLYRTTFSGSTPVNGTDGSNCFLPENTGQSGSRTWNVFNNTLDSPCFFSQKNITLTQVDQNNHLIGYSPAALSSLQSATITDNGNEVFQTEAVANGQGYTTSNFYAPTAGGASIGAGGNLTSFCTAITDSVAATACQKSYAGVTYNQTGHTATSNTALARPASGAWDAGAWEFNAASLPAVTFTPTSISFGNVSIGSSSAPQNVVVESTGTGNLVLASVSPLTITGVNILDFSVVGNCNPSAVITPGSSCNFSVTFVPSAPGARSASWSLSDNVIGSPQTGALTGTATPPTASAVFAAIPVPTVSPLTISSIVPTQSYVSTKGCSQDGLTWNVNCPVRLLCGGCNATTLTTFDGNSVTGTFKTGEIDVNIPLSFLPVPTVATQHVFVLSNPLTVVPVIK